MHGYICSCTAFLVKNKFQNFPIKYIIMNHENNFCIRNRSNGRYFSMLHTHIHNRRVHCALALSVSVLTQFQYTKNRIMSRFRHSSVCRALCVLNVHPMEIAHISRVLSVAQCLACALFISNVCMRVVLNANEAIYWFCSRA